MCRLLLLTLAGTRAFLTTGPKKSYRLRNVFSAVSDPELYKRLYGEKLAELARVEKDKDNVIAAKDEVIGLLTTSKDEAIGLLTNTIGLLTASKDEATGLLTAPIGLRTAPKDETIGSLMATKDETIATKDKVIEILEEQNRDFEFKLTIVQAETHAVAHTRILVVMAAYGVWAKTADEKTLANTRHKKPTVTEVSQALANLVLAGGKEGSNKLCDHSKVLLTNLKGSAAQATHLEVDACRALNQGISNMLSQSARHLRGREPGLYIGVGSRPTRLGAALMILKAQQSEAFSYDVILNDLNGEPDKLLRGAMSRQRYISQIDLF